MRHAAFWEAQKQMSFRPIADQELKYRSGQLKWHWFTQDCPLVDIETYDAASRGPLGAVSLLWRLRLQHILTSCGAFLTLVTLGIDPLAQQVIRYNECDVSVDGITATVESSTIVSRQTSSDICAFVDSSNELLCGPWCSARGQRTGICRT